MLRAVLWVCAAYAVAGAVAFATAAVWPAEDALMTAARADVAATIAIFAFSVAFRNSSFYDAYWSVAPIAIVLYWWLGAETAVPALRAALVLGLVGLWGVRLTWNWARGWTGLHHEDWRYVRLQEQTGAFYWPVSFLGIHMMPTVVVFLGCVPLYPALATGTEALSWVDGLAAAVTTAAIAIEAVSDQQLRHFVKTRTDASQLLSSGIWAWSRHPNYVGEILFWWGLFLFGLAASPGSWHLGLGALVITAMFRVVSLPMIETRMSERKPDYKAYAERTPLLVPRPPLSAG